MDRIKQYIVGGKQIPDWVKEQSDKGRIKLIYNDGDVVGGTIFTVTGTKNVGIGDVIILTESGIGILPAKEKPYVKKEKSRYQRI